MKKNIIFRGFLLTLILLLAASVVAYADPSSATTKNLSTNFTLVNLDSATATGTINYYKPDGSVWAADAANSSLNIAGNFGQQIVYQYFDNTLTAGRGSVIINSSANLGSIVQILARNQVASSAAYLGVNVPAKTFSLPQVLKNRSSTQGISNSQIFIQNASDTDLTDATIHFVAGPGFNDFTTAPISIKAHASFLYDVTAPPSPDAALPDGWFGSAVVSSPTTNLAVVETMFIGANGMYALNGFPSTAPTTNWAIPLFSSRLTSGGHLSTPVVVQNVSGGNITAGNVTLSCKDSAGNAKGPFSSTSDIANNATYAFNPVTDTSFPAEWYGSCTLQASGNVVVFVQMRKPGSSDDFDAFPAFPSNSTNTQAIIPLMASRLKNGFCTVATIQNLDNTNAASVTVTYTPQAGFASIPTANFTIPAGGNMIENLCSGVTNSGLSIPALWVGTLAVTAQSGTTARPIVAFVQLRNVLLAGDNLMTHDAFGLP